MRHGIRDVSNPTPEKLGCYFCNDVVAPVDSLSDRTLDQQCTVTRPGLSGIASAIAVELLATLLNHPDGARANAATGNPDSENADESPLGIVPHQIRGSLGQFSNLILKGAGYDKCTACSDSILSAYIQDGNTFLLKALRNPAELEDITGLTKMKQEIDNEKDMEWDEEEDDINM